MIQKFRKIPVEITAEQFLEGQPRPTGVFEHWPSPGFYCITIHGQETKVVHGDWIIPEPDGIHYYPCKPDIFEKTYEIVNP